MNACVPSWSGRDLNTKLLKYTNITNIENINLLKHNAKNANFGSYTILELGHAPTVFVPFNAYLITCGLTLLSLAIKVKILQTKELVHHYYYTSY